MGFSLSMSLERERLSRDFAERRFTQVRDVLIELDANRIFQALLADTEWNFVFTDRGKHVDMNSAQLEQLDAKHVNALQKAIYAQAESSFQYCYNNYPIYDAYKAGLNEGHVLHEFLEWINGETFLDFARQITGFDDISFADAQATRYKPGHFLTAHDDAADDKNRRVAYVFGFSHDWPVDWGGILQLLDRNDNIRIAVRPEFNSLNLFAVPQRHNVSIVAPFAGGMRFSISGWLRYGDPE